MASTKAPTIPTPRHPTAVVVSDIVGASAMETAMKVLLVVVCTWCVIADSVQGQVTSGDPDQIIIDAAAYLRSGNAGQRSGGSYRLRLLFREQSDLVTPAIVATATDSLLDIASTHVDPAGRAIALGLMLQLRVGSPPKPLVSAEQLAAALRRVNEAATRGLFIEFIGFHSDTAAAVEELLRIARSAPDGHTAIEELERKGKVGRDALIRLDREGGIVSPRARARLESLRNRGFPVDTIRRTERQRTQGVQPAHRRRERG
jgi:hypothetical protein